MNLLKKTSLLAITSILALSVSVINIAKAESNPFASQELVTYTAEESKAKCGEGKCGEGKAKAKCGEGKCGEGKAKAKKCGG